MKIIYKIIIFIFFVLILSCEDQNAVFFPPELGELKITEITYSSAKASSAIVKTNDLDIIECGFCYYPESDTSAVNYLKAPINKSFSVCISGLRSDKEYIVKAYAKNVAGVTYGNIISFKTLQNNESSGTVNGHNWVDLGLPSGIKWATCNIGASTPSDYGNYYAWGETTTKTNYSSSTYTYSGSPTTLPSSADAATVNWGSGWRMPTDDEFNELKNNCTSTWTTQNGRNGRLFTGPNGNSIFLPAAGNRSAVLNYDGSYGYYWSSSLYYSSGTYAWCLYSSSSVCSIYDEYRYIGRSVRPVCNP